MHQVGAKSVLLGVNYPGLCLQKGSTFVGLANNAIYFIS